MTAYWLNWWNYFIGLSTLTELAALWGYENLEKQFVINQTITVKGTKTVEAVMTKTVVQTQTQN